MMYKLANVMANVSLFLIIKNTKLIVINNFLFVNSQKFEINPMLLQGDITNDNVWIKDSKWENYLLQISDSSLKKLDFNLGLNGKISNLVIIFKDNIQSCLSTKEQRIIINFPNIEKIKTYFSNQNSLFFQVEFNISSLSLLTSEYQWETNLENYGEIRKILGVTDNKIWVSLYRSGKEKNEKRLLALDTETGSIIYELEHHYPISDTFITLLEDKQRIVSIYSGISTQPLESPLVEIDAITGKVLRSQRIESLYQENLKIGFWKVLDDKIYFTANKDYLSGTHVGVLDYNTLELLWVTKVENQKGGFKDLQVNHNNIYVLDQGNQLHIFEKEIIE